MTEELFRQNSYLKSCEATVVGVDEKGVRLDRSVFYPTGGGQPGDTGTLTLADGGVAKIVDAVKGDGVVHVLAPDAPRPAVGDRVTATLDWDRRYRHMRMHTALHVHVGGDQGRRHRRPGQRRQEPARLQPRGRGARQRSSSPTRWRTLIGLDRPVAAQWITDEELEARPELVKTMSVRPPSGAGKVRLLSIEGVDLQACGGTHVAHTSEIGRVECVKVENKGKMNRRFIVQLVD